MKTWKVIAHIVYRKEYVIAATDAGFAERQVLDVAMEAAPAVLAHFDALELPTLHEVEVVGETEEVTS